MLKHVLLAGYLVSASAVLVAQNNKPIETIYCELTSQPKAFSGGKIKIKADFGQNRSGGEKMWLLDKNTNKPKIFNSMIDALNYMSKDGWVLVSAHPEIDPVVYQNREHLPPATSSKTYRCILKKEITKP